MKMDTLNGRVLCWFSCGAASAVTAKILSDNVTEHWRLEILYCDTSRDEHPDNLRFLRDVEKWTGMAIKKLQSKEFTTIDSVFQRTRYMSGIKGARCTTELKKIPRMNYADPFDIHAFGFTCDEIKRVENFENNNPDLRLVWPLIEKGLSKKDCLDILQGAGIAIPEMYRLGFKNNNCLGCVKATSPAYWNAIRKRFPKTFKERARTSRTLGVRLVRVKGVRIFLDELPADNYEEFPEDLSCGPQCGTQT